MGIRLIFTAEYNRKSRSFVYTVEDENNIWKPFREALTETWPGCRPLSPRSLSFKCSRDSVTIFCGKHLIINGVSVQERLLKQGDRINLGSLRLEYIGFEDENYSESDKESDSKTIPNWIPEILGTVIETAEHLTIPAVVLITAVLTAAVVAGCVVLPRISTPEEISAVPSVKPETSVEDESEKNSKAEKGPALKDIFNTAAEPETTEQPKEFVVVSPGAPIPEMDLDILFIHAHPDDESLDFGCLLALAESAGLQTGLITFTDGESGLDTWPDRPVSGIYANYDMEGEELASVRAVELENASETLGIDLLIRLGLKNHPYNTIRDELPPEEILEIWGGKDKLEEKLIEIIDKTTPEIVAAPEAPGKAREHFEHEAVGYLAFETKKNIRSRSDYIPLGFITCVDPRQNEMYPEASTIDAGIKIPRKDRLIGKTTLRDVQLKALARHITQNDAVNVGTGFLPEYDAEYYLLNYWDFGISWEEWIKMLENR